MTYMGKIARAGAIAMLGLGPTQAAATDDVVAAGKEEFQQRCAACHGMDGRGGGVVAQLFQVPPKNLATLTRENDGVFPFERVYEAIDGRERIAAHGTTEMPLWGRYFSDRIRREGIANPTPMERTERQMVMGRIFSLVYYIESLQVD